MRQLFLEKGLIQIREVCQPLLEEDMVLVNVQYSCISPGTEGATIAQSQEHIFSIRQNLFSNLHGKLKKVVAALHTHGVAGTRALVRERLAGPSFALGYSCSGVVVAVGSKVKKFRAGDLVACAGAGYANHADIVVVPENLVTLVHKKECLPYASMTTLGAIALQGIRRAQVQLGETVCVIGLGVLGQLTVQLAKKAGCVVVAIDLLHDRLELARHFGADLVLHAQEQDVEKEVAAYTHHYGADVTIITAGSKSNAIVQQAMQITRKKGRVVVVGDVGLQLERDPLYKKEIDFLISCSYGPGRYDHSYEQQGIDFPFAYVRWTENRNMQTIVHMIEHGQLDIARLISDTVAIEKADQAYTALEQKNALAVILAYDNNPDSVSPLTHQLATGPSKIRFTPAKKDTVRIGIIGAGGFAKIKLMPILSQIKGVQISAIVDANIANAFTISKVYGAAKALTHDNGLFDEDLVDAVIIASPHKYHCLQALNALRNGKAVFLEKPMVTDFAQLDLFKQFFKENSTVPFCVDYNRSFAPYIQKIKKVIAERKSPLIALYRMNAGFIPKDHWIQTEIGAGRIIGEACHIVDLFYFLTDSYPISVSVEALRPTDDDLFPTDNFSAQLSFADGSICTLVYTSLGHQGLGKERMELFFDSKTILMDDYKQLHGFGLSPSFNEQRTAQEKGHEQLIAKFFQTIQHGGQLPISTERLEHVAYVTLVIDQLACQGGGVKDLSV